MIGIWKLEHFIKAMGTMRHVTIPHMYIEVNIKVMWIDRTIFVDSSYKILVWNFR